MPTTHYVPMQASPGETATAKLFDADGVSDTVRKSSAATADKSNDKGTYLFAFTDVTAGDYTIKPFGADGSALAGSSAVTFTGVDNEIAIPRNQGIAVLDSATQAQIDAIEDGVALISTTTVVVPSPISEVIGMPETLEIGDSYDDETSINLYVRDDADDPVTVFSGHDLADLDFDPTFTIAPTPGNPRGRVVGVVTYVPAVGPVEGYLKVEISSLQSRRAVEGESSVQCVLKWTGYEKTLLSTTVRWLPRI